ncbi:MULTISPECIES: hypothetical protein [unclassified Streptomyces]
MTDWVADKIRWGLTIDPAEQTALNEVLTRCPDEQISVTRAR